MSMRIALMLWVVTLGCAAAHAETVLPLYKHIFVIVEENRTTDQVIGNKLAPNINWLAHEYGYASNFYSERHPSQPNYIAMLGGDTFGIRDDDAFYCKPGLKKWGCDSSSEAGYVDHTITARSLPEQLAAKGLTWKGYFQDIPQPGSLAYAWPTTQEPVAGKPERLYAAKHNGFLAFASVQSDPALATKIVGFDVLDRDIAADTLPNYAHIIPNQCNDMHGLHRGVVPAECASANGAGLIARADRTVGEIVRKIMASSAWKGTDNVAVVITFDEGGHVSGNHPDGCCGSTPGDPNNPGGGWIATIVVTNHGPRGLVDGTPYNHYSLLRTTEAAFGITDYLGHAADRAKGVNIMEPLFATDGSKKVAGAASSVFSKSIALGPPDKWDYLFYEGDSKRVFVSHRSEITVVDPEKGAVVGRVKGIDGSHGIVVVPSLGRGYADAANTRTVAVFDAKTLQTLKTIPVGEDADAMVYDPATKRVFVMDSDGEAFTAIDAVNDTALATIPLGGKPEFAAVGAGTLFINIASTKEIVRVDARTLKIEARWPVPDCLSPHGLAIDPAAGRLFSSCENSKLIVVTTDQGRVVATLPIGRGSDAVTFDAKRKLIYSSNKDGTLSVISAKGPDEYAALGSVHTALGAKTMALEPDTGSVFLVAAEVARILPPAQKGDLPDTVLKPGTAKLLVVEQPWLKVSRDRGSGRK